MSTEDLRDVVRSWCDAVDTRDGVMVGAHGRTYNDYVINGGMLLLVGTDRLFGLDTSLTGGLAHARLVDAEGYTVVRSFRELAQRLSSP